MTNKEIFDILNGAESRIAEAFVQNPYDKGLEAAYDLLQKALLTFAKAKEIEIH